MHTGSIRVSMGVLEAAIGFEPMHGGFADLSLNHLGTPPRALSSSRPDPINYHAPKSASIEPLRIDRFSGSVENLSGGLQQFGPVVGYVVDLGRNGSRDQQVRGRGNQ